MNLTTLQNSADLAKHLNLEGLNFNFYLDEKGFCAVSTSNNLRIVLSVFEGNKSDDEFFLTNRESEFISNIKQ